MAPPLERYFTLTGKQGNRLTIPSWYPYVDGAMFPLLFPRFPETYHSGIPLKKEEVDEEEEELGPFVVGMLFHRNIMHI